MRYIYGPVKSRRLGNSLGVSLTPYKICNFNCIYCQLGETKHLVCERKEYVRPEDILEELRSWLSNFPQEAKTLNYITLSGFGEPTLNSAISKIIKDIRNLTSHPIAIITNSSLLGDSDVRREILEADLIVPSLDAVSPFIFRKINQPHPQLNLDKIIEGLIALKRETKAKIYLEIMLVRKINDDLRHIKRLREIVNLINPDKIQLNSPVRMTAQPGIEATKGSKLKKIKDLLGENCEII